MLEEKELTAAAPSVALRDEEGAVRADFVERVQQAITTEDSAALRELLGDLHQADVGDLIEALEPELRPTLVRLMGQDFDFTALTEVEDTVREQILADLPPEAVAEGVRKLDSDDAVAILADLPKDEQTEFSSGSRRPSASRWRAACSIRKTPPVGACRPSSSPCRQHGRSGALSTICARRPICPTASGRSTWPMPPACCRVRLRSTGCCAPSGRCR
jgi:hypothetical protein